MANASTNSVTIINTATNTVVTTLGVGAIPVDVSISPDGARAYVTNAGAKSVSVIDTASGTVIATIPVGSSLEGVAVTPG